MFGPSINAIGEHLGDRMKSFLQRNAEKAVAKAAEQVEASGREPHQIPLRTAIPLLEGAAREDDPTLQEMWAALMANASIAEYEDEVPPYLATIISQLTPLEAELLAYLTGKERQERSRPTTPLGQPAAYSQFKPMQSAVVHAKQSVAKDRVIAGIDLLVSLGLVTRESKLKGVQRHAPKPSNTSIFGDQPASTRRGEPQVWLTSLGIRFLRACSPPNRDTSSADHE
jgi:hypothetical protein